MNAIDTTGPETASDERQSHIHDISMNTSNLHWIQSLQRNLEQKQIRRIYQIALERALSIQPQTFHELRQKALCHAIAALSAQHLWQLSHNARHGTSATRELKKAIDTARQMLERLHKNASNIFLYEDLVNGTIFGSTLVRCILCIAPQREHSSILEPIQERVIKLLEKEDLKGKALLYYELAKTTLALGDEEKAKECAQAAVTFSGRYYRKMEIEGNADEGTIWKTKTWSMAAEFKIKITSKK